MDESLGLPWLSGDEQFCRINTHRGLSRYAAERSRVNTQPWSAGVQGAVRVASPPALPHLDASCGALPAQDVAQIDSSWPYREPGTTNQTSFYKKSLQHGAGICFGHTKHLLRQVSQWLCPLFGEPAGNASIAQVEVAVFGIPVHVPDRRLDGPDLLPAAKQTARAEDERHRRPLGGSQFALAQGLGQGLPSVRVQELPPGGGRFGEGDRFCYHVLAHRH